MKSNISVGSTTLFYSKSDRGWVVPGQERSRITKSWVSHIVHDQEEALELAYKIDSMIEDKLIAKTAN